MLLTSWIFVTVFLIIRDPRLCHGAKNDKPVIVPEMPTKAEAEETHKLILQGDKSVKLGPQHDFVLMLGLTGAGKSTLSLALTGHNLTAVRASPGSATFYIVDENNRISKPESQLLSHTIYPEKFVSPNGTVFYDCPGFSDTRSLAHEVTVSYFIRRVIDFAKRLKFLLVVGHDFMDSRTTFMELIVQTTAHIRNVNAFRDSIALIVTKVKFSFTFETEVPIIVSEKTEIAEIAKFLSNMLETIRDLKNQAHISKQKLEEYAVTEQYLDILLQKNGDEYTRIGIMRSANHEGSLSDNKLMQKSIMLLSNMIETNLNFVVKNANEFTEHTLSELTSARITKSLETINKRVEEVLADIAKRFVVYYARKERDLTSIFQFTEDIRKHVQGWIAFQRDYGGDELAEFPKKLGATISKLNPTFSDDVLQVLSKQISYVTMWRSVIPNLAKIHKTSVIDWKLKLDPFQYHINDTIRWYEALMSFNELLASQEVQLQSVEFVKIYGIRNPNRYDLLAPKDSSVYVKDAHIVQNGIHELSFGLTDQRKSFINDIWDTNMQPAKTEYDSKTSTWKIHGFMLKISHIKEFINSKESHEFDNFELFAIDRIFIDVDLIVPYRNLTIIAPVWIVVGKRSINLNGKNAEKYVDKKFESFKVTFFPEIFYRLSRLGSDGVPGRAGQSAGNFFGFAAEIENHKMLRISASGGKGGHGQNGFKGGGGFKGEDFGEEFEMTYLEYLFDSKNYGKFKRSRLEKISFDRAWVHVFGQDGTPGKAGGHGGAGGFGGPSGDVQLVIAPIRTDLSQSKISIPNLLKREPGERGTDGLGGSGGDGGQRGDTMRYEAHYYWLYCDAYFMKSIPVGIWAKDGANGIDGKIDENMENANVPWPPTNKTMAVNNYKLFLLARLNENGKHINIRQIKKLHEHIGNNKEIKKLYAV